MITEILFEDLISFFGKGQLPNGRPVLIWQYKTEFLTPKRIELLSHLADRLIGLRHPNILEMLSYQTDGETFYTLHEYCDTLTSVEVFLQENAAKLSQLWGFATQISGAMKTLEHEGLAWGGINTNHLMIDQDGQIKLTKIVLPSIILRELLKQTVVVDDAAFLPPEWLETQQYSTRSDIFAYGVLLYHLFGKGWPYATKSSVATLKKRFLSPPKPFLPLSEKIPSRVTMLITIAIQTDPNARFETFSEMLAEYESDTWSRPVQAPTNSPLQSLLAGSVRESLTKVWKKWAKWILLAAAGVLLIMGGLKVMDYSMESDQLPLNSIPKLRGMDGQAALKFLEKHKLHGIIAGTRVDPKIPSGSVVETKPPEGREVRGDREVRLYLSRGPGEIKVPYLIGKTMAEAGGIIEKPATLNVTEEIFSYSAAKGVILSQNPSPNAMTSGAINVTVSGGYPVSISTEGSHDGLTSVNVYVAVLQNGPPQQILIQAKAPGGTLTTLHSQGHPPGFQNSLSFDVASGSTVLVFYNGTLVRKESLD